MRVRVPGVCDPRLAGHQLRPDGRLPGQRTVWASTNVGPPPPAPAGSPPASPASTARVSVPSITTRRDPEGRRQVGELGAASVDDGYSFAFWPSASRLLFSHRKMTGSWRRAAMLAASCQAPSSSAPSPKRQTLTRSGRAPGTRRPSRRRWAWPRRRWRRWWGCRGPTRPGGGSRPCPGWSPSPGPGSRPSSPPGPRRARGGAHGSGGWCRRRRPPRGARGPGRRWAPGRRTTWKWPTSWACGQLDQGLLEPTDPEHRPQLVQLAGRASSGRHHATAPRRRQHGHRAPPAAMIVRAAGRTPPPAPGWRRRREGRADARDRSIEVVEALLADPAGDLTAEAAGGHGLVGDHARPVRRTEREDGLQVERLEAAQVDDLGARCLRRRGRRRRRARWRPSATSSRW